jgi:iron complex outermembrane receptor protein
MKFEKKLIVVAIAATLVPMLGAHAAEVDSSAKTKTVEAQKPARSDAAPERTLAAVTTTVERESDVQTRTELGRLTEYTPLSGVVVDREEVEHLQLVNNLLELGKRVPGISMIRNMRIPDGGKNYTENRVDGMRVSDTSNTSLLDEVNMTSVDHIEIITGPGSALYGSGSVGGTFNVFTRQPPRDLEAKLSQEFGDWGFQRTQGSIGKTTANGKFGFLLTGSTMDNDGWRRQPAATNNPDSATEHKEGAGLRTLFRPSDTTRVTLGLDKLTYDFRQAGALPMDATESAKLRNATLNGVALRSVNWASDWRNSVPGIYGQNVDDYQTYTARLQQTIGERSEVELAWAQREDDGIGYGFGGSGGSVPVVCDNVTVMCNTVNYGSPAVTNTLKLSNELTQSARLQYRHEFDWAKSTVYLGTELIDIRSESATYNNVYTALQAWDGAWAKGTMTATGQGSVTREKDVTPYLHFEVSPTDRLRLHIGERFDRITYSTDDRTSANRDVEKTYTGAVTKSGLTYDLTPGHLLWANVAQTFNAPASSTLLASGTYGSAGYTPAATLDPEKGLTHEIGFRGTFANYGLHYDIALYHTSNKGFVVSRNCTSEEEVLYNAGAACSLNENAGRLTAKGLESMFSWAATDWLDLGMTYTNAQAYYNEYVTKTVDYSGNSYQAMPRQRMNLRVAVKPAPGWRIELEGDHISSYYIDTENSSTYQRPDLFTLRASYTNKKWTGWLHIINLTDEKYATRVSYSTIGGVKVKAVSAGQGNSGTYLPLTVRVGVAYKF